MSEAGFKYLILVFCLLSLLLRPAAQAQFFGATGAPSGPAGGDLTGTYPNPTLDLSLAHAWTAAQTVRRNAIGVTSTDGYILENATAATAGNQQWSPRLRLTGAGWKTDATAASQQVDWIIEGQPVQAAAQPDAELVFLRQKAGGGYQRFLTVGDYPGLTTETILWLIPNTAISTTNFTLDVNSTATVLNTPTGGTVNLNVNNAASMTASASKITITSGLPVGYGDVAFSREAAGLVDLGTGAQGSVAASLKAAGYMASGGTTFTISGCSATSPVGGATAGTFTSGTTGACTVTITMNGATGLAAPTGWACSPSNRTTANLIRQTASTTTTGTISGTTVTGDVISFYCVGY